MSRLEILNFSGQSITYGIGPVKKNKQKVQQHKEVKGWRTEMIF